jgi:uncharacterized protein YndB with AHSA1/START domain
MIAPAHAALEFSAQFPLSSERLWPLLTESAHLEKWFCDEAESVPGCGGRLTLRWRGANATPEVFVGRWVRFEPHTCCSFEGGHDGYPAGGAGLVMYSLTANTGTAMLHVTHTFPDAPEYASIAERYRAAWPRAIERLARLVQTLPDAEIS